MTHRRIRAYIGLGANVGDATATLTAAVATLSATPGLRLRGVSRLYATAPVGVTDQPEFRNAVIAVEVATGDDPVVGAVALLATLKDIERRFGRRRRRRWGPRELDLDLLVFGRERFTVERPPQARSLDAASDPGKASALLEVPHPAVADRLFVLAPLADLAPGLVPPGWRRTVASARRRRTRLEDPDAVRVVGEWDPAGRTWRRDTRDGRDHRSSDATLAVPEGAQPPEIVR